MNNIPKVMIGVPTMNSVNPLLMMVLLSWVADGYRYGKYELSVYPTVNVQPVDNARNDIVEAFLKSDATHLFFIDSDTIPQLNALEKMLAHDLPIVSGLTPIVELDEETQNYYRKWNCVGMDDKHMTPNTGLRQCKGAGGSCIMIKREVFEKMKMPYYRFIYKDDTGKDVMVSEDIYFVINALSLDIKTMADTTILANHMKNCLF